MQLVSRLRNAVTTRGLFSHDQTVSDRWVPTRWATHHRGYAARARYRPGRIQETSTFPALSSRFVDLEGDRERPGGEIPPANRSEVVLEAGSSAEVSLTLFG